MFSIREYRTLIAFCLLLIFLAAPCESSLVGQDQPDILTVDVSVFPPMVMKNDKGEFYGFDIDLWENGFLHEIHQRWLDELFVAFFGLKFSGVYPRIRCNSLHTTHARIRHAGSVRIQANTILFPIPHLTAENLFDAPTPITVDEIT